MAKRTLTQRYLESLKPPKAGQLEVWDLGGPAGFYVRVSSGGVKTFGVQYRRGGKKRRYTIGRFPSLTLADAREKAKRIDANKEDPQAARVEARRGKTFTSLMALYFQANRRQLKPKTLTEWMRIAKNELRPEFGSLLPQDITRADLRTFLDRKAQKAPYMSNRVLEVVRRVFSWGVETDKVGASPCVGLRKAHKEKQRERVLSHDELRTLMSTIEKTKRTKTRKNGDEVEVDTSYGRLHAKAFFELALLTAARKSELLDAQWRDVDLKEQLWTIPDTKMGRAHVLPLSTAAVAVLEPLPRESRFVFRDDSRRLHAHPKRAITDLRDETGLDFRIHDLRRTTATGLAQLGVRTEVISAVLNHVIAGPEATRVYQRHSWIPEMRKALERWAGEIERIRTRETAKVARMK